jgi:hypothetical protein
VGHKKTGYAKLFINERRYRIKLSANSITPSSQSAGLFIERNLFEHWVLYGYHKPGVCGFCCQGSVWTEEKCSCSRYLSFYCAVQRFNGWETTSGVDHEAEDRSFRSKGAPKTKRSIEEIVSRTGKDEQGAEKMFAGIGRQDGKIIHHSQVERMEIIHLLEHSE